MAHEAGLHRLVATVVVVTAVLCLGPAAHSTAPDPTWIAGFYDNADFDDVVLLIAGNLDVVEHCMEYSQSLWHVVVALLSPTDSDTHLLSLGSSAHSRAPPNTRGSLSW
jgi:hypothetical protein